jgi:hypothetical protein
MNSEMPRGLTPSIGETALPLRDELVARGWVFGVIHWDNESQRTLAFIAKSPSGKSLYVACEESALARRLQNLLDSN